MENSIKPLFEIETMLNRVDVWNSLNKKNKIKFEFGDLLNHRFVYEHLRKFKPDHIIHYGEQPSAIRIQWQAELKPYLHNQIISSVI